LIGQQISVADHANHERNFELIGRIGCRGMHGRIM
jgi:hypothetical protein